MLLVRLFIAGWICCFAIAVQAADCFDAAASKHGLDAELLRAVARAESDMRPHAVNRSHESRTGTRDIGLMQINSGWLPILQKWGIDAADLLQPCINIDVGAWIMARAMDRHGPTWNAVGAYNAACTRLKGQACTEARSRYAWRVFRRMQAPIAAAEPAPANAPHHRVVSASPGLVAVAMAEQGAAQP